MGQLLATTAAVACRIIDEDDPIVREGSQSHRAREETLRRQRGFLGQGSLARSRQLAERACQPGVPLA